MLGGNFVVGKNLKKAAFVFVDVFMNFVNKIKI